jgi:predicted N-formylglutamate amidohydrolase
MAEEIKPPAFLSTSDPPPVEIVNPEATMPLLLTGDHAGNLVPAHLGNMGLPEGELKRHIGWDIGVAGVARALAARLQCTAVLASYTRLLIDVNRPLGDPQSVPPASDGTPLSVNLNLSDDDRFARTDALFWPYHRCIDGHIGRLQRGGLTPIVLALHSFTPALNVGAKPRPWHVGVLYGPDERFAKLLLAAFRARGDLVVGANEPYSGITHGYGLKVHGVAHGLPHAELEIRQDLIGTVEGQQRWADLLAEVLKPMMSHPDLNRIEHY